jgi:N-acylglucosamine-6-phosphate 2-epimerase
MTLLERLRGGLIVSVQAWPGSAIDEPSVLAAIAAAAVENGACAVRMQGVANIAAARARLRVPIVGLIKREYPGYEPYITPTLDEVRAIVSAGAEIVAFDATGRPRPASCTTQAITEAIDALGGVAMADCATADDAARSAAEGAPIVATTLCGYTRDTTGTSLPALELVRTFARLEYSGGRRPFVICEGGVRSPAQVAAAFEAGSDAVVVGTAITNIDALVREFAARAPKSNPREG